MFFVISIDYPLCSCGFHYIRPVLTWKFIWEIRGFVFDKGASACRTVTMSGTPGRLPQPFMMLVRCASNSSPVDSYNAFRSMLFHFLSDEIDRLSCRNATPWHHLIGS